MGEFLDGRPPRITEAEALKMPRAALAKLIAAYSIRAARDYDRVFYDSLSELPNQLALDDVATELDTMFTERVENEWIWFGREIDRVGVVYIDLDRFKQINDLLGHPEGDKAIISISMFMSYAKREGDMVFRSHKAGDEFVMLLPFHTPADEGDVLDSIEVPFEQVVQPLIETIEDLHFLVEDKISEEKWMQMIGATYGKAVYNPQRRGEEGNESLHDVINHAEERMRGKKPPRR